jgi:hypothetical protein
LATQQILGTAADDVHGGHDKLGKYRRAVAG